MCFNFQIGSLISIGLGNGLAPKGDRALYNPQIKKTQPEMRFDIPAVKLHSWIAEFKVEGGNTFTNGLCLRHKEDK